MRKSLAPKSQFPDEKNIVIKVINLPRLESSGRLQHRIFRRIERIIRRYVKTDQEAKNLYHEILEALNWYEEKERSVNIDDLI